MKTARIPPVDAVPATIAAVLAIHAGHICSSSEVPICPRLSAFPMSSRSRYDRVTGGHVQILMQAATGEGVTSVAGFRWIR